MNNQRIRIRLKGYDHRLLDQSAHDIVEAAKRTRPEVAGPIQLPTDIWRHTVNRWPHADKKSMEQFEMRTHKRLLDIIDPAPSMNNIKKLNLPPPAWISPSRFSHGTPRNKTRHGDLLEREWQRVAWPRHRSGTCTVLQKKTPENDGYHAVRIGLGTRKGTANR